MVATRVGRVRSGTSFALAGILFDLALALAIGALRNGSGSVGERHAEGALPTVAIALAVAAPGIVALVGVVRRRAALYLAAAIASLPLAIVSIAVVPIWISTALFAIAFFREPGAAVGFGPLDGVIAVGFAVPVFVGLLVMITHTHPYTYRFADGGESGDAFTRANALRSIVLTHVDVAVVAVLASVPRTRSRPRSPIVR